MSAERPPGQIERALTVAISLMLTIGCALVIDDSKYLRDVLSLDVEAKSVTVQPGLVTGFRAPRELSPQNRLSDSQNWHTVELVLEGAVFLTMGLQIKSIVTNVQHDLSTGS